MSGGGAGELDAAFRAAAFTHLETACAQLGDTLSWDFLRQGFEFRGERWPIMATQQGIYKPRILALPLSFKTTPPKPGRPPPYQDGLDASGMLTYRYRGTDPQTYDNVAMRRAMTERAPLIYFYGVETAWYMPVWPVFIVGDQPSELAFKVAVDEERMILPARAEIDRVAEARRSYITALTTRRLHQATFRQRVLRAYQERCAICQLKRLELLEAAHILPDRHPQGDPVVSNGLALCNLHHAAFDRYIIGITPDLVVEVRQDVLEEVDGPMLRHGLQEISGMKIYVPRGREQQPDRERIEERYRMFKRVG